MQSCPRWLHRSCMRLEEKVTQQNSVMRLKPLRVASGMTPGDLMQGRELENQEGDKDGASNVNHPRTTRPRVGEDANIVTDMGTCPQRAGRTLLTKTARDQPRVHW